MTAPNSKTAQPPSQPRYLLTGLALAIFLFIADQASKILIREFLVAHDGHLEILPFFNLVTVWNYGISFGMFQSGTNTGVMILIAIAAAITALFAVLLLKAENRVMAIGCGTIIGGSCGNIVDRIQHGAVYDFLDFHAFGYHWPAFNVADSCVLIGIAIIAYDSLFLSSKSEQKAAS